MAAHHLTIAKASFTASLLRPEEVSLSRDSITQFHKLLDAAVFRCTPENIQKCKEWIASSILPYPARTSALGKYLLSLSKHLPAGQVTLKDAGAASIARRRLHILYLLNDLLHHTRFHSRSNREFSILTSSLQPFLAELFSATASEARSKVRGRLESLLEVWKHAAYFSTDQFTKLQSSIDAGSNGIDNEGATDIKQPDIQNGSSSVRQAPYIMPATHGDPNTPYYDLPAGNLLPHIIPNSTIPIRPDAVRPLQFLAGPADESLIQALEDFMEDIEKIDDGVGYTKRRSENEGLVAEIDELGQILWRDEVTGDVAKGDTYYGWSRDFCEKMKRRRDGTSRSARTRSRSRAYSSSMSRSRSRSRDGRQRPKRQYSSYSRSRSHSHSTSLSPERLQRDPDIDRPSFSSNKFPPPQQQFQPFTSSTLQSPPPPPQYQNTPPPPPPPFIPTAQFNTPFRPQPQTQSQFQPPPPPPPLGLGPNGLPIPPPRPQGYMGPWPPPPPPPPSMAYGLGQGQGPSPPPSMGNRGGFGTRGGRWRGDYGRGR